MEDTIAIINQLIEEHKIVLKQTGDLEVVANDAAALINLNKTKEVFMPGRLDQHKSLRNLKELLERIEKGLTAHFNKEETQLLAAFQKDGDDKLVTALQSLMLEHKDIKDRFDQQRKQLDTITAGRLSAHVWQATAYDLRAHITHTRKLLQAHTEIEMELFHNLRKKITEKKRG